MMPALASSARLLGVTLKRDAKIVLTSLSSSLIGRVSKPDETRKDRPQSVSSSETFIFR